MAGRFPDRLATQAAQTGPVEATAFANGDLQSVTVPSLGDFLELLKPRVMALAVFTAVTGLIVAPGTMHPVLAFVAVFMIAAGAGACGALNMWYDADIDGKMARTRCRPLPQNRIEPAEALGFGVVLSTLSVMLLGMLINWVAGGLLAFTIFFYSVVYTVWLKRRTPQNIVIGGAAGALPPVIGWAAATGTLDLMPLVLFAIIFLWTPPHFWSLALVRHDDYDRAGVPMLPNVAGDVATRRQIAVYSVLMAIAAMAPVGLGMAGALYALIAGGLGIIFIVRALALVVADNRDHMRKRARSLFGFSILYLFMVFAALLLEAMLPGAFIAVHGVTT